MSYASVLFFFSRFAGVVVSLAVDLVSFLGLQVDGFDLFAYHSGIVLQVLHLPVHLVNEAVAFLAGDVEEAEVVLECDSRRIRRKAIGNMRL